MNSIYIGVMSTFLSRKKILPCPCPFTTPLLGQLVQTSLAGFKKATSCIYVTSKFKSTIYWPAPTKGSWDLTFKRWYARHPDKAPDDSLLARQASVVGGKADLQGSWGWSLSVAELPSSTINWKSLAWKNSMNWSWKHLGPGFEIPSWGEWHWIVCH